MNKQKTGHHVESHFHLMYLITGILESHDSEHKELFQDIWTGYYQIENIDDLSALTEIFDILHYHKKTMAKTLNLDSMDIIYYFMSDLRKRIDHLKSLLINILL